MRHHQRVVEFALHLLNLERITEAEKRLDSDQIEFRTKEFMRCKADDDARRFQEIIDCAGAADRRSQFSAHVQFPHIG